MLPRALKGARLDLQTGIRFVEDCNLAGQLPPLTHNRFLAHLFF